MVEDAGKQATTSTRTMMAMARATVWPELDLPAAPVAALPLRDANCAAK